MGSTLYTSLPHARLKNQLHDLLERVFHTKGKSFIATNYFRTFWTNDRMSMRYIYFSCRELCLAIDFLIDNIHVLFGSSIFRQVIGIPMGTNSAVFKKYYCVTFISVLLSIYYILETNLY